MRNFSLIAMVFLLSGCVFDGVFTGSAPATSGTVTQTVYSYSPAFQKQMSLELKLIDAGLGNKGKSPACARDEISGPCSAIRRSMTDYKLDRDQGRRLGAIEVQ